MVQTESANDQANARGGTGVNYDVLESLQPVLIEISERTDARWHPYNYDLLRERTDYHSLAYMTRGEGRLELDQSRYALRKGVLIYVPAGSRMRIVTSAADPILYSSVIFRYGQLRWEGQNSVWNDGKAPLPLQNVSLMDEVPAIAEHYRRLTGIWKSRKAGYVWHSRMEFLQLLHRIMQWLLEESQEGARSAALIDSIITYLRDHLHEPFDRTEAAARLALSPGYFSVLFKRYTGYTPVEYVTRLRIDRAKQLLIASEMPIGRIAEEVGYSDPLYFSRLFTRLTGVSPREFRKL